LRLPHEAEWEYAARAGAGNAYDDDLNAVAWHLRGFGQGIPANSRAVRTKAPNGWGLYDLLGNVWEWVDDWYWPTYGEVPPLTGTVDDPAGGATGVFKVLRGADYLQTWGVMRLAMRHNAEPTAGRRLLSGGRLVRSLGADAGSAPLLPAVCDDAVTEARVCGADGGGIQERACVAGQWLPFGACSIPEACAEGEREARDCDGGAQTWRCVDGQWSATGRCEVGGTICDGGPRSLVPPCNACPMGVVVPFGFVCAPAGDFRMGYTPFNEGNFDPDDVSANDVPHRVRITRPFFIQATELTAGQVSGDPANTYPATGMSYAALTQFVELQSWSDGLPPGLGYRLPTEAEWEYAARAGALGIFYGPGQVDAWADIAWTNQNADGLQPVATRLPNAWGLHDVLGNARELTSDLYADNYGGYGDVNVETLDPLGLAMITAGEGRAVRGGSYQHAWAQANLSLRENSHGNAFPNMGVRLVRSVP
jgi:formylglycine-generating enzyme required for sulfatase activity